MVDDISIPEIKYQTDFESNTGGWEPDGFVRIQNMLPQIYKVSLIQYDSPTTVTNIELDGRNHAEVHNINSPKELIWCQWTTGYLDRKALFQFSLSK